MVLPLRIHIAQGPEFGCTLTKIECHTHLVPSMNEFWSQASIQWNLVDVCEKSWSNDEDGSRSTLECICERIWSLQRDNDTGKMANKEGRREVFLDGLLSGYENDKNTFDLYVFDFIGQESQGTLFGILFYVN